MNDDRAEEEPSQGRSAEKKGGGVASSNRRASHLGSFRGQGIFAQLEDLSPEIERGLWPPLVGGRLECLSLRGGNLTTTARWKGSGSERLDPLRGLCGAFFPLNNASELSELSTRLPVAETARMSAGLIGFGAGLKNMVDGPVQKSDRRQGHLNRVFSGGCGG